MGTVTGMLAASRSLLGTVETPPGSNRNKVTAWYGLVDAWCDMAIAYAADQSGNLAVVGRFAWTPAHAQWFVTAKRWHYGLGGARAGDVVFFDWSGTRLISNIDHVGLVEAVRSDGTIVTLEGNTLDVFARRVRNGSVVVGYGRPAYDDARTLPAGDGILRAGATGAQVTALQQTLNRAGAKLQVDGEFGPSTEAALRLFQTAHHLEVDGQYGPSSAAALKAAAAQPAAGGMTMSVAVAAPKPAPPAAPVLPASGVFGPSTTAALQRFLNRRAGAGLTVDGAFGPRTKRALQQFLHVAVDGVIGPATVKALQRWVGAKQDGIWGTSTTRGLQIAVAAYSH